MEIKSIVGAKLGSLSLNRSTSTNPFDKTSFRGKAFSGSVLPFADVFQAIKPVTTEKPNKVKMIAGAVIGAVVDFKTKLTQPIALFAQKVRERIAHGIDAVKNAKNSLVELHHNVHEKIANAIDRLKVKPKEPEVVDEGAKVLSIKNINEHARVQDLKATWIHENEKITQEEGKAVA